MLFGTVWTLYVVVNFHNLNFSTTKLVAQKMECKRKNKKLSTKKSFSKQYLCNQFSIIALCSDSQSTFGRTSMLFIPNDLAIYLSEYKPATTCIYLSVL